jgi:hypothetical protein
VGVNASGTTPGGDLTFMTTACKPSRVFVSVLGLDTNDCSNIATPCRTINGAIAQVAEDGEAVVIKSGSYAGAMITKGVKVNAASGVVAFSGQPVTVNAPFAKVVIRGLTLKALTPGTGDGILIQDAGAVFLENVVADGWDNGVKQVNAGEVFVKDSVMRNNVTGYWATDGKLAMDNVRLTNNGDGIYTEAPDVSVRGSTISGSTLSGIYVEGGSVTVEKSQITNNDWSGITVCMEPSATARVSRSLVSGNGIGLENLTGSLYVYGNNAVRGNTLDTSGTITPAGLQ